MRRLITLMLAAAVLASCSYSVSIGGSDTIDPDEVEGAISGRLKEQNPDLPVSSVTCPEGVKPAQGVTFECTAHVDGAQWPIEATITQVPEGAGNVEFDMQSTKALLIPEWIVNTLKAMLRDQGVPNAKVDCGTERYRVVEVGGALECTVSAGGKRRVVRVVAKDVDGRVDFEWPD